MKLHTKQLLTRVTNNSMKFTVGALYQNSRDQLEIAVGASLEDTLSAIKYKF